MRTEIHVYGKAGCQMCDTALELLDEALERFEFDVRQHNIHADRELFDRYRYRVPVVVIAGIERLALRFDREELEAALEVAGVPRRA